MKYSGTGLAAAAMAIYILGGLGTFIGLGLIVFLKGHDLWGWGDGRTIGYLFVCLGLAFSIAGVLMMRILRNRIIH